MTAQYQVHGDVAVITLNNPPVNGLGFATRVGITDGLTQANADAAVKSIVITGAGKAFSGGADIKEFGSPRRWPNPICCPLFWRLKIRPSPSSLQCTPYAWVVAWSWPWGATTALPLLALVWPCLKSSSA